MPANKPTRTRGEHEWPQIAPPECDHAPEGAARTRVGSADRACHVGGVGIRRARSDGRSCRPDQRVLSRPGHDARAGIHRARADGNLWFTEPCARQEGSPEACQAQWTDWAGYTARTGLYPFDGYTWQRDGNPIPGQTTATYTPTTADVGHQLGCRLTVSYSLPFSVTATSTSQAITVQSAPPPPPTPALSALDITPRMFTLTGRRVGGRCLPLNRSDRGERSCIRRVALRVRFTLSVGATVTFAIERVVPGRLTRGWCSTLTRGDRRHRPCTRQVMRRGKTVINGRAGADEFTFTGKTDGRALVPGSYRLLATPTADGIAGQRQQTTFELKR